MNKKPKKNLVKWIIIIVGVLILLLVGTKLWEASRYSFKHSSGSTSVSGGNIIKKSDGSIVRQVTPSKPVVDQLTDSEIKASQKVCANLYLAKNSEITINLKSGENTSNNTVNKAEEGWIDLCVVNDKSSNIDSSSGELKVTSVKGSANVYSVYGKR